MKRLSRRIGLLQIAGIAFLALLMFLLHGCAKVEAPTAPYTPEYSLSSCEVTLTDKSGENEIALDRSYDTGEFIIRFGSDVTNAAVCDRLIDNLTEIYALAENAALLHETPTLIVSDSLISDFWEDASLGFCVSVPPFTPKEEALAWLLTSQNRDSELPFGVYAGIAAHLSGSSLENGLLLSGIPNNLCYTELQFPLYGSGTPEKGRRYAWRFSGQLVSDLLASGKDYANILEMSGTDLNAFLSDRYGVTLPNYTFEPYSKKFEYRVRQGCFTYYINREYTDLILPSDVFSTSYPQLSDWLKDNRQTTDESNRLFRIGDMYDITVYLEDGLLSTGISGAAFGNTVTLYSVGSFSHEYLHHILYYLGKSGNAREVIPELHANSSEYSRAMWYYLFSGNAKHFPYNAEVNEKETYLSAMELYRQYSAEAPTADNFDFWAYADCFSAIHTHKGETFISRLQSDSLAFYTARVYGGNAIWALNTDTSVLIQGKTYAEIADEWYEYIKAFQQ
ncbi:MAG TPA: hypothetical protein DDW30_06020 [Clostridiales bacterium]|nr:hypothetical protein [Clostridiales bacterium]